MAIKVLDSLTAEQIAAGEVIENPASVVKELVENSLDAGASVIRITVQEGGKKMLTVTDDGSGILSEDLPLAFKRFATSKLVLLEDLQHITSLGFRGEALPSIATVARVNLTTRPRGAISGARIKLAGGRVLSREETGAAEGTVVEVRDLFYNTPGRLKFLRAAPVEAGRITTLITEIALAHPEVSFVLANEKREVLQTSGDGVLRHVIASLYGSECAAAMLPLEGEEHRPNLRVSGYISPPHLNRASRRQITIMINGRIVHNNMVVNALERGYGTFLPSRRHPVAVLHLKVSPTILDVNVHPAKTEIRFQQPEAVKELVYQAVKTTLQHPAAPRRIQVRHGRVDGAITESFTGAQESILWKDGARRYALDTPLGEPGLIPSGTCGDENHAGTAYPTDAEPPSTLKMHPEREAGSDPAENCRLIGQFLHSYLVVQRGDELLIIDQHAAHERVIYEMLSTRREEDRETVQLTVPLTVEVPVTWGEALETLLPLLQNSGFKMEPFGDNSYIIRAYPFNTREQFKAGDLYTMLEELVRKGTAHGEDRLEQVRKTVACHRAIKAHQPLSRPEMEQLLQNWEKSAGANYCPHGRPAVITLNREELQRGFNRRGGGSDGR